MCLMRLQTMKIEFKKAFLSVIYATFHFRQPGGLCNGVERMNKNHNNEKKSLFGMYYKPGTVVSNVHSLFLLISVPPPKKDQRKVAKGSNE